MTVISDTSPLNYLVLIDLQDVLPALFGHVLIPEAVRHELRSLARWESLIGLRAAGWWIWQMP
jgi:predicted nucleic acid-binding protein